MEMKTQEIKVEEYIKKQALIKTKHAAKVADELLNEVTSMLKPGVTEEEITKKAIELFKSKGVEKNWHNPYIRFGENTILTFKDKPTKNITLKEEDIAYIDIGPIIDDTEGDVGYTVYFGENKLFKDLKEKSELLFNMGVEYWRKENPTGIQLYEYLVTQANEFGYDCNLPKGGHLIGLFPHAKWSKENLGKYPYEVYPGMWILEIQIRHPQKPYGAFYERILI